MICRAGGMLWKRGAGFGHRIRWLGQCGLRCRVGLGASVAGQRAARLLVRRPGDHRYRCGLVSARCPVGWGWVIRGGAAWGCGLRRIVIHPYSLSAAWPIDQSVFTLR